MPEDTGLLARWKLLRAATRDGRLSRGDVACLGAVLDRINGDTGTAWPSLATIGTDACVDRRTAARAIARLVEAGYLEKESGSRTASNRYAMGAAGGGELVTTGSDEFTPTGGGESVTTGSGEAVTRVVASSPLGVVVNLSPELAYLNQPTEPAQEASASLTPSGKLSTRKKAKKLTFQEWLDNLSPEENQAAAERISTFIAKIGAPEDYADIFMQWAADTWSDNPDKAQASWPRTIDNYLRNAWHRLWAPSRDGGFYLTTAGEQLRREIAAEAGRPAHASSNRPRRDLDAEHVDYAAHRSSGRRPSAVEQVELAIAARHRREGRAAT